MKSTDESKVKSTDDGHTQELQRFLLSLLSEEASEIIQSASKCTRFTPAMVHPDTGISNLKLLQTEIGDLCAILAMLHVSGIATEFPSGHVPNKIIRTIEYMRLSVACGTLSKEAYEKILTSFYGESAKRPNSEVH